MTISAELQKVYAGQTDVIYLETLSFTHSLFAKDHYVINDVKEHNFYIDSDKSFYAIFLPVAFVLKLPAKNTSGNQDLQFAIDNVGREMMLELEAAQAAPDEPIVCTYRVYLENTVDEIPENDPPIELTISDIVADVGQISATARRFDILSKPFPSRIYDVEDFPGLRR